MTNDTLQFIADEFPDGNPFLTIADYVRLRDRAIALEKASLRVARLNPNAGEIGAGMLKTIVEEARNALNP
jgi:hypothetical protein